ncbi:MAG: acyl-CoA dehydrogenase family protein [Desulfobacterium sp.]
MDLDLRKDQQMIKKTAREFLDKECPRDPFVREMEKDDRGITDDLWRKMADLGWLGLLLPEKYGGMECDFLDLIIVLEEMGRACLPGPFLQTSLAGLAILWEGSDDQKERFLSKIADGDMIMTLALNESMQTDNAEAIKTTGESMGKSLVINGVEMFVPDAHIADYILCPVRIDPSITPEEAISLVLIDPCQDGVECIPLKDTIAGDKLFRVELNNVEVPVENHIGVFGESWSLIQKLQIHGALSECARMLGGARRVLDLSVDYAKKRKQFDRPIGSFQIIQHYLAAMLTDVDASQFITYQAAWKVANGQGSRKDVSMAKVWVNEAYYRTCVTGHQVHGGVGFTQEFDVGLYFRRAKAQEISFGDTDYHCSHIAQEIGLR